VGATDSKPREAGNGGAPAAPSSAVGSELLRADAVMASGRVSEAPSCEGSVGRLSCIGGPALLDGSAVCPPLCGPTGPSVAATASSRFGRSGALFIRAKVAAITAAPASANPPAASFQLRAMGVVAFRKTAGWPLSAELFAGA
jgi:hypothetical protein